MTKMGMMYSRMMLPLLLLYALSTFGQSHSVPSCSKGNQIEIAVENSSGTVASNIKVAILKNPTWLQATPKERILKEIGAGFQCNVDKSAPIGSKGDLAFLVSSASGEQWIKTITLVVAAPERFELFQNYPNPFNPITTLAYQLARDAHATIVVYNMLAQRVGIPVDADQLPGYHQVQWDASSLPSGVYYMRFQAIDQSGKLLYQESRKLMMLR